MQQQKGAANVLKREVAVTVRERAKAPADTVFDVLADLPGHFDWGGAEASTLLSIEAPALPAAVGTEFTSTGEDAICRMRDSSVVTEAARPSRFERVTDSALELKRNGKPADWVLVHRYEMEPDGNQCGITYTCRLVRASALPGALSLFGIPGLRSIAAIEWSRAARAGLRRLVVAAETRARV